MTNKGPPNPPGGGPKLLPIRSSLESSSAVHAITDQPAQTQAEAHSRTLKGGPSDGDVESTYTYEPLPHDDSIRLLHLLPGKDTDLLSCTLSTTRLSQQPSYSAVSYVWGSTSLTSRIQCNNKYVAITDNLNKALTHIRRPDRAVMLWTDAICIEQSNLAERGHQVKLMGDVYSHASEVLICFDNVVPDSHARIMSQLLSLHADELVQQISSDSNRQVWNNFWRETWFTRVWTAQEVGLAKEAIILYGDSRLRWSELMSAAEALRTYRFRFQGLETTGANVRRLWTGFDRNNRLAFSKTFRELPESLIFIDTLHKARYWRRANDARDYVYAFLAHPKAPKLEPDYSKSVSEVNLDFARAWISKYEDAALLSYAKGVHQPLEATPSWCPAWSLASRTRSDRVILADCFMRCQSSGDTSEYQWKPNIDSTRLTTSAVQFDHVSITTPIIDPHNFGLMIGSRDGLEKLLTNFGPLASLFKTLTAGQDDRSEDECLNLKRKWPETHSWPTAWSNDEHGKRGKPKRDYERLLMRMYTPVKRKRLFKTRDGRLGIGPSTCQEGDACFIIEGARVPFLLRSSPATIPDGHHKLVGECYINGVMEGQIMSRVATGELKMEEIVLE